MKVRKAVLSAAVVLASVAATPVMATDWPWSRSTPTRTTSGLPVAVPKHLDAIFQEAAAKYKLDPKLLAAVTFYESRFDTRAVSSRGAQGLMQLMPRTARALGVRDAFDPRQNIMGGAKYLRMMLDTFNGDLDKSLAAYNAGPEAVKRKGITATDEAVRYVAMVKRYYGRA